MSSTVFSPKGQTLRFWVNGEKSIRLPPFRTALPTRMTAFLTPTSNQFLQGIYAWSLFKAEQAEISLLPYSLEQTGRLRKGIVLLVVLALAIYHQVLQLPRNLISCFLSSHSYSLIHRCRETCHTPCWNWKAQRPRPTTCQSNSTAHTKRRIIWQDRGHPCWLWQIPDSLSKHSQSFHLITCLKTEPRSTSIYTWPVDCHLIFSAVRLAELVSSPHLPSSPALQKSSKIMESGSTISPSSSPSLQSVWVTRT